MLEQVVCTTKEKKNLGIFIAVKIDTTYQEEKTKPYFFLSFASGV